MNVSSWRKENANLNNASTSLTLWQFQTWMKLEVKEIFWWGDLLGGRWWASQIYSEGKSYWALMSYESCQTVTNQDNVSKSPSLLEISTLNRNEINANTICVYLFHKFVSFNQQRMRWSVYDNKNKCVLQHNTRCNQWRTRAPLALHGHMLWDGKRHYANVHLSRSTLITCFILGSSNWRRGGCNCRIVFILMFPFLVLDATTYVVDGAMSVVSTAFVHPLFCPLLCIMHFPWMGEKHGGQSTNQGQSYWNSKLWVV